MIVFSKSSEMREWSFEQHKAGKTISFVPTMGYLHDGHLSLVSQAQKNADVTVLSIFVNPAQFAPGEDYNKYPRDEKRDIRVCEERGVDVVYIPEVNEMYPDSYSTYVEVEGLTDYLCGKSRPTHFRGVATIVTKLFNIVNPDIAVFGQKDAQQARIIEQLCSDLQFNINIVVAPIVREQDGLAMSSRNVRLTDEHRKEAPAIYRALMELKEQYNKGVTEVEDYKRTFSEYLSKNAPDAVIDYVEVVDWNSMSPVKVVEKNVLIAVAAKFSNVRLIDNIILEQ